MEAEAENNTQKMDEDGDNSNENNNGSNSKIVNSNGGHRLCRIKRKMKTPLQLETLEKTYAMETYPSEETRAVLSEKLGLTDRQLQMWFCHRRLKDRKLPKQQRKRLQEPTLPNPPIGDIKLGHEPGNEYGSGSGSSSSPFTRPELRNVVPRGVLGYYESPQTIIELRAIACVEAQLGEPLREDVPSLGIDFDPLPPDAFDAPIAFTLQQKRPSLAYDNKIYEGHNVRTNKAIPRTFPEYPSFLPKQPGNRADAFGQFGPTHLHDPLEGPTRTPVPLGNQLLPRIHSTQSHSSRVRQPDKHVIPYLSPLDNDVASRRESYTNIADAGTSTQFSEHPIVGQDNYYALPGGQVLHNDPVLQMEKKKGSDDTIVAREDEAYETRIKKELEKQDNLRRKNDDRLRKEMERQGRERKKEEERLARERQREEERSKRKQKREMERREKFLLKESLKAEKRRQRAKLRREKETERRKAALEKAAARRIAKESMELIDDEQLELMDLAAASKGLSSIINLDLDTLQNLESFRDSLCVFPPLSVKLRKPFAIQPWVNSEQNVGNLLMVWRFLITFADVLELWPFTLDELLQAFHDYDSRLLGEIHVALLKVIIKDIEDVARTPSTGLGVNQNGAANHGGGHPEIVEGAYSWGFDIRNWQKNLNQLTWPEIFRQVALSAGFGPQLKKRNIMCSYANDKSEGRNCEDIISTLRNGSAAESAVAKMHEKGLLGPRRSRHRLTPGTVKFAAFHVLSLESSKGLTVLDLAEKIQKSGLRDLTTSKTPEASISVALTRDTKLFERIAPSTYRVRSAFRKDPADAESILSEARKKIQIFENGFLSGEDADDVEREDSESEVDDDPEVDDLVNPSTVIRNSEQLDDTNVRSSDVKVNLAHDVGLINNEFDRDLPCFPANGSKDADCSISVSKQPCEDLNAENLDQDNMEIDESKSGESWVQGLTEGEYSDLSVEERLNALVVLVGVANEGNSIRIVLEDRLEAANALKKQMWAEAQIDKFRLKDDIINKSDFPPLIGNKVETQYTYPAVEGNQSPLLDININNMKNEALPNTAENQNAISVSHRLPVERSSSVQDLCPWTGPDNPQTQVSAPYSKRSRSQMKSYISHMAEEMCVYRSLPLGQDRRRNRYWLFVASASSNDPGSGRIFVECHDDGNWRLIDSEEAFDILLTSLDSRGIRESHLRLMLKTIETSFKENVRKNKQCTKVEFPSLSPPDTSEISPSFKIELGKSESEKKAAVRRYQDFQKWMWKECYKSSILCAKKSGVQRCKPQVDICDICLNLCFVEDFHCNSCHCTFPASNGFNISKHAFQCEDKLSKDICISESSLPLQTRLFKFLLAYIEASVLPEAFRTIWTDDIRKHWGMKLSKSSSVKELLQILTIFERAIRRDFLSSNFATTDELLGLNSMLESAAHASTNPESVAVLPWVPQTTAALCLRLFEIDSSISYVKPVKPEPREEKEANEYSNLPSRYTPFKFKEVEPAELDNDEIHKDKSAPKKVVRSGNKRGRGSNDQGRSKKLSKRPYNSKRNSASRNVKVTENLSLKLKQQPGRETQGQAGGRGRRTVRKRRVEKKAVEYLLLGNTAAGSAPLRSMDVEWEVEKASPITRVEMDVVDNSNSTEEVEYDDNVEAVEYDRGNWEIGLNDMVGMSDEDLDAYEDNEEEDSEEDIMSEEGLDGMTNRVIVNEDLDSDSAFSEDSSD